MPLNIKLLPQQIQGIASAISRKDIYNYVNSHQAEYEQYLKEQDKPDSKQFTRYTKEKARNSTNKRKIYRTNPCIIWHEYKEEENTQINRRNKNGTRTIKNSKTMD